MSFTVNRVSGEKELTEIYRLRYKIYCLEWGFEKPENHSNGILTDIYDNYSQHFAARDYSGKIVGAIRLILHSEQGFPIEKYCHLDISKDEIPRDRIAEISRLAIHRDFRRRAEDKYIYGPDEERRSIGNFNFSHNYSYNRRSEDKYRFKHNTPRSGTSQIERRKKHEILISLYKAIYQESKRRQLSSWYAVMTQGIVALLDKFGLKFDAIGDPVDYHGIRTPYFGEISKIEQEMSNRDPELYEEFK
ncbi:MAG: GNAT family N-acetyltransferase [Nitrospirae bacterium]|nr:GNAT family N-acetyltransferase [Nitrospirota bacterium]